MIEIGLAQTDEEINACFAVMSVLRPHLRPDEFTGRIRRQQKGGYQLLSLRDSGEVKCVAGYRLVEYLAWGKVLYIDDLITLPGGRQQGYGGRVLDWLIEQGRAQACAEIHLDTGYQRHEAHRLYLRKGFQLNCHHLAMNLSQPG